MLAHCFAAGARAMILAALCGAAVIAPGLRADAQTAPPETPAVALPRTPEDRARRARRGDFDARGQIACAQQRGAEMAMCAAGIVRGETGAATVVVTFGNGFARMLEFRDGQFVSANPTMSGTGADTDWERAGDLHLLRVDDQRFALPHALVFGP
jgi:hypothetical protein